MAGTKKAEVIADVVAWTTKVDGRPLDPEYHRAGRGDKIELPTAEFDRLAGYGAVAELGVAAQAQVERDELDAGAFTDDELAGLNAAELVAYVNQHPEDARRVFDLEQQRKRGARSTVVEATGFTVDETGAVVSVDGGARVEDDGAGDIPAGGAVVTS